MEIMVIVEQVEQVERVGQRVCQFHRNRREIPLKIIFSQRKFRHRSRNHREFHQKRQGNILQFRSNRNKTSNTLKKRQNVENDGQDSQFPL